MYAIRSYYEFAGLLECLGFRLVAVGRIQELVGQRGNFLRTVSVCELLGPDLNERLHAALFLQSRDRALERFLWRRLVV